MSTPDDWFSEGGEADAGTATATTADPFADVLGEMTTETPSSRVEHDTSAQKRAITVIMIVDTSGSMEGAKIGQVNQAIKETVPALKEVQASQQGVEINIALLQFASDATWITPMPEAVERFTPAKLENPYGGTNIGFAFGALHDKLSRSAFLSRKGGHFQPLILLLSDGEPTDDGSWQPKLDRLYSNLWFQASQKIAIAIGDDANTAKANELFARFTGNDKLILHVNDVSQLAKLVKAISVHASKWSSQGGSRGGSKPSAGVAEVAGGDAPDPVIDLTNSTPEWWPEGGSTADVGFDELPDFNF